MRTIFLLLLLCISPIIKAQKPFTRDFWLNEAATPIKVNAMLQDTVGYIWLGTDEGLLSYDGMSFTKITDSIYKPVTAIANENGNIWIGYANGKVGLVNKQHVEEVKISNCPTSPINSIYVEAEGHLIFISTENGVFAVLNNTAAKLDETKGLGDNFTYGMCVYPNHVLVGCDKGINDIRIINNKLTIAHITSLQGLSDNIVRVIKKVPGTQLCWIGTQQNGIDLYNEKTKKIIRTNLSGSWKWGQINDILPVTTTHAWIATESGYLLEANIIDDTSIGITPYYNPDKAYKKLLLDAAGNVWCGTNKGLTLMTGEYLRYIKLDMPYLLHDATAMVIENDTLFIALQNQLFQLSIKNPDAKLIPIFSTQTPITSLYIDKDKRLWIGTWGDGVFYMEHHNAITNINNTIIKGGIINIAGTSDNLWVSGLNGVEQLTYPDKQKVTLVKHHDKKSGIGSDYVYQLYPDHHGNIWMATDGAGVCMYDGNQYHHWSSFSTSNSRVAYSIAEDTAGDIWAGVLYKDIYHLHNNQWDNIRRHETQYVDINISSVAANATGQVVSVSQRCIDEWYPRSKYFRHFNNAMRMGIDSTSNVLNCIAKDKFGNVYLPYQHGILIFKNQDRAYSIQPHVHITRVNLFLKPVDISNHKFSYDENYLSFFFGGINFSNPERLNYRYTLEGYNNDWVNTRDGGVTYPKLPPGKYNFRVQTSLNSGFEGAHEDSYSFTIDNPFWKTLWFYIIVILACLGIIYAYIQIREKRLNKILQLKQERMRFEYEHLKSQINPHFLFNSLNTLTDLIEENKEHAIDYTVHLSDLYRYILAYPDKDLILLSEEMEILNNYMHIQKSRFGTALDISLDIPSNVLNSKKIIPLALQMLVENAIKHNIVSAAQPLIVSITANNNEIVISNTLRPKISTEKKSGLGLINIVKRYRLLTERPVTYGIFQNEYIVTLPLL
ncbi:MAG: histidine kinase [Flavipsychrobacter sp.]|nr:histidine kinase [Flavipsychrobacter sp.]